MAAIPLSVHPRSIHPHPLISCRSSVTLASSSISMKKCQLTSGNPSSNALFSRRVDTTLTLWHRKDKPTCRQGFIVCNGIAAATLFLEQILFLNRYVTDEVSNVMLAQLLYMDSISSSKQKVTLLISCPGGDLAPGMALYDTAATLRTPLYTINFCEASNLGAYLLSVGKKGKRCSMPYAQIALQPVMCAAHGQADNLEVEANELIRIRDYLHKEFAKNTGQPLEKVYEDLMDEKSFNPQKALEYGIIDHILKPPIFKE